MTIVDDVHKACYTLFGLHGQITDLIHAQRQIYMRLSGEPAHSYRDIGHDIQGILTYQLIISAFLSEAFGILHRLFIELSDDIDSRGILSNALLLLSLLCEGVVMYSLCSRFGSGILSDLRNSPIVNVPTPGMGRDCADQCCQQQYHNLCSLSYDYIVESYATLSHSSITFCCLLTSLANFRYFPVSPAFSIS